MSCDSKDKIVGEWKKSKTGRIIKIEAFGDMYQGTIMTNIDTDEITGWRVGDIGWTEIKYMQKNKYKAIGRAKGDGVILEENIIITFIDDNTISAKAEISDDRINGSGEEDIFRRVLK